MRACGCDSSIPICTTAGRVPKPSTQAACGFLAKRRSTSARIWVQTNSTNRTTPQSYRLIFRGWSQGPCAPSYTLYRTLRRECKMNRRYPVLALTAALGLVVLQAQGQAPRPNADPYANNADPGKTQFPLAAPAGKDSGAITNAPPGAANQGMLDPAKWKYG